MKWKRKWRAGGGGGGGCKRRRRWMWELWPLEERRGTVLGRGKGASGVRWGGEKDQVR